MIPKIKVITYATASHERLRGRLNAQLDRCGLEHMDYTSAWMKTTPFFRANRELLRERRGAGYWAWKPFILQDAMNHSDKNDIICYMDSSTILLDDPTKLILENNFMSPQTILSQSEYTKRDCFVLMECDEEKYWNAEQVWAGIVIIRPGQNWFVEEWAYYCTDRRIISDDPNVMGKPNLPYYRDHRHDQSILTNLIVKHSIPTLTTQLFEDT